MDATSRLWMAGVVSARRDRSLADRLLCQVRACCHARHALLVCTDEWAAYPKSIMRAFRDKVKTTAGRGRACLEVWPELCIATVIKRSEKKRVVEVTRRLMLGTREQAEQLLHLTAGCHAVQYLLDRALQWHDARTAGGSHAQMSARCPAPGCVGNGHVPDRMHLQLLLCSSCIESRQTLWVCLHSGHGCWVDRSSLDDSGGAHLQGCTCPVGEAQARPTTWQTGRRGVGTAQTTARTTS